jgi:hypothetical protein
MKTSFKQLFEAKAKKAVTREEAKALLKKIKTMLRPDMIQGVDKNGADWDLMIRDSRYFTSRPGEEDDDWPDFTGEKDLMRMLNPILKGIEWTYSPEEKDWITISLKAKKLTAKAAAKEKKKKVLMVIDAVANEKYDADDYDWRRFYTDLLPELKDFSKKKKFITKEQFYRVGQQLRSFEMDAAEEVWSMA